MTERISRLYPFLFAMLPVLHMVASNPGEASPHDVLVVLSAVVAGCALVYGLSRLVLRGWDPNVPALVAFLGVVCFYGVRNRAALMLAPLALAASLLALRWLSRHPPQLRRLGMFLTLTGGILVGWSVLGIGSARLRAAETIRTSALVRKLAQPIPAGAPVGGAQPRRDIYLIVLDEYANSRVLRDEFGYDNRPFEDSLRRLGFVVPAVVQSNYAHTNQSLPSLLNASHLTAAAAELGRRARDPSLVKHLFAHSRVARFLQDRGYQFVFFPSAWWPLTEGHPLANQLYHVSTEVGLERELSRSDLRRNLLRMTVLDYLFRSHSPDAEHVRHMLAGVARVPRLEGPAFVVAHLISPHRPYIFDRDCRTAPWHVAGVTQRVRYVGQLQCLNRMVLQTVTALLRESAIPLIILLQGDHGTAVLKYSSYPAADSIPVAAARERLGAFGAYYLPSGGREAFGDTVTVVNVLGNVLRHYFNADLPREPDDRYISLEEFPYALHKLSPRWLGQSHAEARQPGVSGH